MWEPAISGSILYYLAGRTFKDRKTPVVMDSVLSQTLSDCLNNS